MSLSDSSSDLSTPPLSDTEPAAPPKKTLKLKHGKLTFSAKRKATPTRESSPEEPEREPSPPHDYVLADNSDIAVRCPVLVLCVEGAMAVDYERCDD